MDRHASDSHNPSDADGPQKTCSRVQCHFHFSKGQNAKPQAQCETHEASAREQFQVIVMCFLWCDEARSIMVGGDTDPIPAKTYTQNRTCREHFQSGSPDLVSTGAAVCGLSFWVQLVRDCLECLLYTSDAADERSSVDLG